MLALFTAEASSRRQLKDRTGAIEDFQKAATLFLEQGRTDGFQNAQAQINASK